VTSSKRESDYGIEEVNVQVLRRDEGTGEKEHGTGSSSVRVFQ